MIWAFILTGAWALALVWPFSWGDNSDVSLLLINNLPPWVTLPPFVLIWTVWAIVHWGF